MNVELYEEKLHVVHTGWAGTEECRMTTAELPDSPIIKAFLEDNDMQQLTLASTNLLISWCITKIYRKSEPRFVEVER